MPEAYPRSNPWPYVFSGLLLFGVVLFPPQTWPELMRDASVAWVDEVKPVVDPLKSTTSFQAPNSRVVVGYDPRERTSIVEKQSLDLSMPVMEPTPNNSVAVVRKTTTKLGIPRAATWDTMLASQRTPVQLAQPPVGVPVNLSRDKTYVWSPPRGWKPQLIDPISEALIEPAAESPIHVATSTSPKENALTVVEIAGPVANHTSSSARPRVAPKQPGFELTPSVAEVLSPAPVPSEYESQQQIGSTQPIADPIAEPTDVEIGSTIDEAEQRQDAAIAQSSDWGSCKRLYGLLELGAADQTLHEWAKQIRIRVSHIRSNKLVGSKEQQQAVANLRSLANFPVDANRWDAATRETYLRIRHAVTRQTDVWSALASLTPSEVDYATTTSDALADYASKLNDYLAGNSNTEKWGPYLELDRLSEFEPTNPQVGVQSERTLGLLHNSNLTETQKTFLTQPAFRSLEQHLREAIAAHTTAAEVIDALDAYENQSHTANARAAIAKLQRFSASTDGQRQAAALQTIDGYYRNANVRVSVSEQLINRFVPAFHEYAEQVNDTILGAAVRGRNSTMTNLSVDLIPDPSSIRLKLYADGLVDSNTASRKGPVVLYNKGKSRFAAGKELLVRPDGIFSSQTETRAVTGNRVVGMRTDLDGFPFLGALVRSIARQQADEQRPFMRAEILRRVKKSASQKMDVEVQRRLASVEQRVHSRVVDPLQRMQLAPRSMEMRTTKDRVILRARLAGPMQLGSHTPRPQAVADNQMSIQVHQTAANNTLNRLKLNGRRMTLSELAAEFSTQLGATIDVPKSRRDVEVRFADHNPAEFEFENGQIKLTIHFAELDNGTDRWKNFSVCAYYRADVKKLEVQLIRDGGIELITKPLGLRDQIALRSIFTKVLSANPRLNLLRKAIQQQPSLRNLTITQFTIRDGWICISLGEAATTMQNTPAMATKPSEKR